MSSSLSVPKKWAPSLDCFIILDKPQGLSSNQALGKVKRLLSQKKAGHAGTLDPMATGLLPIAFGRATKLLEYCLDHDKRYVATIQLGEQTDTGDKEGEVTTVEPIPEFDQEKLDRILQQFMGNIEQIPPMYSALKHEGRRLYQLARNGETVERPARKITIKKLTGSAGLSLGLDLSEITIDVTCTKGTYVRVLGEDIAKALGTVGHLTSLCRIETAGFEQSQMLTLAKIEQNVGLDEGDCFVSMEQVLTDWPRVDINQDDWLRLCQGKTIDLNLNHQGMVRLLCGGQLIAVAELEKGWLLNRKIIRPIN